MKLRITVEGKSYDVEVEVLAEGVTSAPPLASTPAAVPTPAAAPPTPMASPARPKSAGSVDASRVLRAPIIGTVTRVNVNVGDTVAVDDVIIVMEAMKMETKVATAMAARVKTVCVRAGEAVKAGQVLVEFE
jgi:glutaconyl-CoA/methylmalonyl-CoA decarboxylase subunit gamma